jgi:hypothetical protein
MTVVLGRVKSPARICMPLLNMEPSVGLGIPVSTTIDAYAKALVAISPTATKPRIFEFTVPLPII